MDDELQVQEEFIGLYEVVIVLRWVDDELQVQEELMNLLNSLMIIHVHKDLTDKINIREICNDFISKGERRHQVFGTF